MGRRGESRLVRGDKSCLHSAKHCIMTPYFTDTGASLMYPPSSLWQSNARNKLNNFNSITKKKQCRKTMMCNSIHFTYTYYETNYYILFKFSLQFSTTLIIHSDYYCHCGKWVRLNLMMKIQWNRNSY